MPSQQTSLISVHTLSLCISNTRVSARLVRFLSTEIDVIGGLTAGILHNVVVHVQSTEDVVVVVKISLKHRVPIVVRSGGTGLESQSVVKFTQLSSLEMCPDSRRQGLGSRGSICVDMSKMDRILHINGM